MPAHSVDPGPGRGGGRADEEPWVGGRVGHEPEGRPEEELREGRRASGDVSAHVVLVVESEVGRRRDVSGQDQFAEARSEALDLRLDPSRGVERRAERDMAIRPHRVPSGGRAGRIEQALLREDDVGLFREPSGVRGALRGGDLLECRAEVNGRGPSADGVLPRHRAGEGHVDLEGGRTIAVTLE